MKKKLFLFLSIAIFIIAVMFNISLGFITKTKIDMVLANIEALAETEEAGITCTYPNCRGGMCHDFSNPWNSSCPCSFIGDPKIGCYAY